MFYLSRALLDFVSLFSVFKDMFLIITFVSTHIPQLNPTQLLVKFSHPHNVQTLTHPLSGSGSGC